MPRRCSLIAARGYEATTLRDIAKEAGVSVGLLYRYFPSKQAVVIALYDELSAEYARQAADMPPGQMARPVHLRAEHEPRCAQAASGGAAGAHAGAGRRPRRGHLFAATPRSRGCASSGCSRRPSTGATMRRSSRWLKRSDGCCTSSIWRCCCGGCWTRVRPARDGALVSTRRRHPRSAVRDRGRPVPARRRGDLHHPPDGRDRADRRPHRGHALRA